VLPPISTEGMTSAQVGKLADDVRDQMLKTLREISTPSPEATTANAARIEEQGEQEPLLQDSRPSYTAESSGVRRRSPSSKSAATSEDLAQTGAVDARTLVGDVAGSVKRAAVGSEEGETDEETEDGVIVNKPN
jgi:lysophosphatidate acyltransferase